MGSPLGIQQSQTVTATFTGAEDSATVYFDMPPSGAFAVMSGVQVTSGGPVAFNISSRTSSSFVVTPSARFSGSISFAIVDAPPTVPQKKIMLAGDSIYNTYQFWQNLAAETTPAYSVDPACYGGTCLGTALMDFSDQTYAYVNGAWTLQTRGRAFSDYTAVCFDLMRNEAANETVTVYQRAYDKLIAQAAKYVSHIVANNCPPQAKVDLSGWDVDPVSTGSYLSTWTALVSRWNVPSADTYNTFLNLVSGATYTVAQLMRDIYHPTIGIGNQQIANLLQTAIAAPQSLLSPTPYITGSVVTYLFGQVETGTWTQTVTGTSSSPGASPLARIAGLPDQAMVTSDPTGMLQFPTLKCEQVWLHFLADAGASSNVTGYVDRLGGSPVTTSWTPQTSDGAVQLIRSRLIAGGLNSAVTHTVEVGGQSGGPLSVVGITYVGVS